MAFNGINLTPIGGNSRAGIDLTVNAPMGWGYASATDSSADIQATGYFDSINKIVAPNQFIYCALTDGNFIFTFESVNRQLQQVTLAIKFMQPIEAGPDNVTPIFNEADFGEASGGKIILDAVEHFSLFRNTVFVNTLEAFSSLVPPFWSFNEISSTFFPETRLNFNAQIPATALRAPNIFFYSLTNLAIFDVSNLTPNRGINTLLDLNRTSSPNSFTSFTNVTFRDFDSLGVIANSDGFTWADGSCFNCGPLLFDTCKAITLDGVDFTGNSGQGDIFLAIKSDDIDTFAEFVGGTHTVGPGEAVMNIDPYIGAGSLVQILDTRVINLGGVFFKAGITGSITGWADNSSTGNVTGVVDNLDGTATVTTDAAHNLETFQTVDLSSMTISAYDGSFKIQATPTTTTLIIILDASAGTATGTWATDSVTVTTVNSLSNGQTLLIEQTIDYKGGAKIYAVSGTEFSIDREFISPETTGTWDTGSLTGRDTRIRVSDVQGEPDSEFIASLTIDSIDSPFSTTIAVIDTYQDMDFSGETPLLDGTERYTLVDADNGTFRYDAPESKTFNFSGFITGEKASATANNYAFALFLSTDGGMTFNRITSIGQSLGAFTNAPLSVPFAGAVVINPDDRLKMQVKNVDGTAALLTSTFNFNLT